MTGDDKSKWLGSDDLKDFFSKHRNNDVKINVNGIAVPISGIHYNSTADQYEIDLYEGEDLRVAMSPMLPPEPSSVKWTKMVRGHYRDLVSGVQIIKGRDQPAGYAYDFEAWFVYEPVMPYDTSRCAAYEYTLKEAKVLGEEYAIAVRYAMKDPSYEFGWSKWHEKLREWNS